MKKRIVSILVLLTAMAFLFMTGCGKGKPDQTAQNNTPAVTTEQSAKTGTPAQTEASTQEPEQAETLTQEPEETEAPAQEPEETEAPAQEPEETEAPAQEPEITEAPVQEPAAEPDAITVEEDGEYSDKDHVALYLHIYGRLPSNYVTKKEAEAAGWNSSQGNLVSVLPGKSIGGDKFGNYERRLPEAKGRKYYECDINYNPKGKTSGRVTRGSERIIFSNDGLIFYTSDHYNTFEQLY